MKQNNNFVLKFSYKRLSALSHSVKYALALIDKCDKTANCAQCLKYLKQAKKIVDKMIDKIERRDK